MSISSPKLSKGTRIQNTGTGAGDHEEDEPTEKTARNVAQVDRIKPTRRKSRGEEDTEYQNKAGSNKREKH